ncbi:hypothetical protein BC833DRAFT_585630 [Globomyces pollinis-pini]|nr:hypothetical protein BC833DRAFT_585630 [Globomyces pollinis-pini]
MTLEELNQLFQKRIYIIEYIQRTFSNQGLYYGTIKIPLHLFPNNPKRADQYFQLGMSLGALMRVPDIEGFVKGVDSMITEFEYYCNDGTNQSAMSKVFSRFKRNSGGDGITENTWLLDMNPSPFPLDFNSTLISCCDMLKLTYEKLLLGQTNNDAMIELMTRIDLKVWKISLVPILRDIDNVSGDLLSIHLATHFNSEFKPK